MTSRGSFGGGTPGGPAGGDLAGSYPSPTVNTTSLTAPLPLAQGGTGSATQNFVDLASSQMIAGAKTFTSPISIPTPVATGDAVTKGYADGISAGVTVKQSVAAGTNTALPANVYLNGTAGLGATLTASANGVLTVDGYTVLLNDRILVKNEALSANNGIYTVTTLGTASVKYVLTRTTDMDNATEVTGTGVFIGFGTINAGSGWVVVGAGPYVIGTTAILFTQFTSPGLINAGNGLTIVGNTVSLVTPVAPANLPPATTGAEGVVQLAGDLAGTATAPTVTATTNVNNIIRATRIDQFAAPNTSVPMSSQKITGLANGTSPNDAAAFGQIPTTLPPNGAASGDLAGTYPSPTLANTANVQSVVRTNRLDQMAAPTAAVSANSQKITNLANGTASTDAAAFGQIPTTFAPSGSASGDLSGTYPSPTVAKVNGVSVTGTPAFGQVPTATSGTASAWGILPNALSTGLLSGCVMSQNVGTPNAFDLTAGTGYIVDYITNPANPTVIQVSISAQTLTLGATQNTRTVNYWYANSSGTVLSQATVLTSAQRRSNIQIGYTWSVIGTGNLYNIFSAPVVLNQPLANLFGLGLALGSFSTTGNLVSANGANLNINKSAGNTYTPGAGYKANGANSPNAVTAPSETAATFRYVTQATNSQSATRTTIDVANFDNGGVITALATNAHAAIHRVYLLPTGTTGNQIVIQYGQVDYTTLAAAQAAIPTEPFIVCPDIDGTAALIGYIVSVKNATTLNNTAQAVFIGASKFAQA